MQKVYLLVGRAPNSCFLWGDSNFQIIESGPSISPVEKHNILVWDIKGSKQKDCCPIKFLYALNFLNAQF
jgi:hypothetical protein